MQTTARAGKWDTEEMPVTVFDGTTSLSSQEQISEELLQSPPPRCLSTGEQERLVLNSGTLATLPTSEVAICINFGMQKAKLSYG